MIAKRTLGLVQQGAELSRHQSGDFASSLGCAEFSQLAFGDARRLPQGKRPKGKVQIPTLVRPLGALKID
jgi:hypothetical protein